MAHQLMLGSKSKWCAIFFNHVRSQIIRVLSENRIPSPERDFKKGIVYGTAGKVIHRGWWSPRDKKGQKTSPPQMLKGQEEETVAQCRNRYEWESWRSGHLSRVPVMEGRRLCQSPAAGRQRRKKHLSLLPCALQSSLSGLWSAVRAFIAEPS